MNNEEKILAMLEALTVKVDGIDSRLAKVEDIQAAQGEQLTALADRVENMDERLTAVADRLTIVDEQLGRVAVTQEEDILPYIKLLDEGHQEIMHKLANKGRVEVLEKDVRLLKNTAKNHAQRLSELEKAN